MIHVWEVLDLGSGLEVALGRLFGRDFLVCVGLVRFLELGCLEGRFMFGFWAAGISMHKGLKTYPLCLLRSLIDDESSGLEKISCVSVSKRGYITTYLSHVKQF